MMPVAEGGARKNFDLQSFDLSDMIECGRALREVAEGANSMEAAAGAIVQSLFGCLWGADGGARNCALVRCFKTHRFGQLPDDLGAMARKAVRDGEADAQMPCLTLLATAGERPEWNDRRASKGHAVIPLESVEMVERAPMIAALVRQMGLEPQAALYPGPQLILDAEQHAFNVFHVEDAVGAASIPGQDEFVKPCGIRSVLGFGGLLPTGDLFAVIMFARVRIPRETADLFRTIALGVKLALLPFSRGPVWESEASAEGAVGPRKEFEDEQLRTEIATLRLLIPALEDAALFQTERLKATAADLLVRNELVRQQGMRLTAMLEATNDAVFLLDRDWKFTFLNGHAQRLIARGRELLGTNIWEMFPEAVGKEFWTQYKRVMDEGESVQFQEYYPEPLDKWFEVHAFPSEDGMAAFFRDVTQRLKTDAKLRQTEKLAATGRMAASIAHEINNPLESVTNLLYLLNCDSSLNADSKSYVESAERELQRVSEITTHMLRFYRQSTKRDEVDLAEVLESVLVLFHGRMLQAGLVVEKQFGTAPKLKGFAGELRQVFANLVGNALDASPQGGRLVLRLREGRDPVTRAAGVRVSVGDTGSGMNEAAKAKLFEPFFTTKGITGTGLGLWVSRQLIRKHGGAVRVRSAEGERRHGTVFSVFFPFDAPEVSESEMELASLAD